MPDTKDREAVIAFARAVQEAQGRAPVGGDITAAEAEQDDRETREFMGTPSFDAMSPEELREYISKKAYEGREATRSNVEAAKTEEQHNAAMWADKNDAETVRKINQSSMTPGFIKTWASDRVSNRRFQPEAERAQRAEAYNTRNQERDTRRTAMDSLVPDIVRKAIDRVRK